MSRLLLAVALVAGTLAATATPAFADGCHGAIGCTETTGGGGGGLPDGYGQTAEDEMPVWAAQETGAGPLSGLPPGSTCLAAVNTGHYTGFNRIIAEQAAIAQGAAGPVPSCPADNAAGATRDVARRRLPTAQPHADPGKTYTGLPVYLEFGLAWTARSQVLDELPSQPTLEAHVTRYEVQWTPGGAWEPVDGPGVSYADRTQGHAVTHQYRTPGTEPCAGGAAADCTTIRVRVHWHLTVTGLAAAPLVYGYAAPEQAFQLRIVEVQAVRRR
ncbi:MAG: hypothetical protein JWN67_4879 [Actinomycetia bacterium]|nr:hypothetical protein [Actinomycetes bacterium]